MMMKNPKKFLIAENPFSDDGRVFIVHTRHPYLFAEAFHFELTEEKDWMECKRKFNISASVDYPGELIVIGCLWHEQLTPSQDSADELAHIMRLMGDWYFSYLKFEDEQIKNILKT